MNKENNIINHLTELVHSEFQIKVWKLFSLLRHVGDCSVCSSRVWSLLCLMSQTLSFLFSSIDLY